MFGYLLCLIAWLIYLMSLLGSLITLLFLGFGEIRDLNVKSIVVLSQGRSFPGDNGSNSCGLVAEQLLLS